MRVKELLYERKATTAGAKIKRDAFLYMDPQGDQDEFAQCSTCQLYIPGPQRCAILGPHVNVPAEASCGLYTHGEPNDDQEAVEVYKPKEVGLVRRQVRCENCVSFDAGTCKLYQMLNETKPEVFDLDDQVDEKGCCNAQMPK